MAAARTVVTVGELKSRARGIASGAATDLFIAALVKSGAFSVDSTDHRGGTASESHWNGGRPIAGAAGARYLFVGTLSEASMVLPSLAIGNALSIELHVVDASNGLVLDAINACKAIAAGPPQVHDCAPPPAVAIAARMCGEPAPADDITGNLPDISERMASVVCACIDTVVLELVNRYGSEYRGPDRRLHPGNFF
jgi:hypothetical protein